MDVHFNTGQNFGQATALRQPDTAPPPAKADGRITADAAAIAKDPRPDIPVPFVASPTQAGLVSKAALSVKDTAPKLDTTGVSSAERTLKPYGINMLPEKRDAAKQEVPPQT